MKPVSYKDPYSGWITVAFAIEDYDDETMAKALEFLNDDARVTSNLERKERDHVAYHLEGLTYEGTEYAADVDIEEEVSGCQEEDRIDAWLQGNLTVVQYRRFRLFMEGMSVREVARAEGIDYSSANESIKAAQKKIQKIYGDTPSKHSSKSPYSEKELKERRR